MQNTPRVPKAFRSITQLVFCKAWLLLPQMGSWTTHCTKQLSLQLHRRQGGVKEQGGRGGEAPGPAIQLLLDPQSMQSKLELQRLVWFLLSPLPSSRHMV